MSIAATLVFRSSTPDQPGWWVRHIPSRPAVLWFYVSGSGGDVRDTEPLRVYLPSLEVHVPLSAACEAGALWAGPVVLKTDAREIGEGP